MTLPNFSPGDDPGPSFSALLARVQPEPAADPSASIEGLDVPHGTTVVATRFADGVIIAGDRRATSGNLIRKHG